MAIYGVRHGTDSNAHTDTNSNTNANANADSDSNSDPTPTPTPTPPPPPLSSAEVVLYAAQAPVKVGGWVNVSDLSAAAGVRIYHTDAGAPKVATPFVSPPHYFEMTFSAEA